MKIYRFLENRDVRFGVGENDRIWRYDGTSLFDVGGIVNARPIPAAEARLLPPVMPSKIVAVGRNYAEHARELGNEAPSEPIIFLKPPTAILGPGGTIVRPPQSQRVDYEGELAMIIGETARNVSHDDWRSVVFGFTCANDVTARDLQKKDGQFTRGK